MVLFGRVISGVRGGRAGCARATALFLRERCRRLRAFDVDTLRQCVTSYVTILLRSFEVNLRCQDVK